MPTSIYDDRRWTIAGAKAKLSEVIERGQVAPQTITRNGKPSVVVVSAEEWQKKRDRDCVYFLYPRSAAESV